MPTVATCGHWVRILSADTGAKCNLEWYTSFILLKDLYILFFVLGIIHVKALVIEWYTKSTSKLCDAKSDQIRHYFCFCCFETFSIDFVLFLSQYICDILLSVSIVGYYRLQSHFTNFLMVLLGFFSLFIVYRYCVILGFAVEELDKD